MIEIKYLRPELLEAIARNTLKKYDESLVSGYDAKEIPIEEIIESMGLSLEYQYIRNNGRILGETVFDDAYVPIYNMDEKRYELIFVERGTIILDASLLRCRTRGRHRFTAAHELAHWLIHQELYSGTGDAAAMLKSLSKSSEADRRIELQADMLASALLLPISQVKKAFYRTSGEDRVSRLAAQFGVSNQAMEIRLRNHHLI
ncbi:MAG TPA: ImmA/IrrE family metallo-endopeptidase [Bacillota bacterium]|nr:ImmA/IrrE family metallo-endopeptidase [Bacillota bacterium]